MNEDISGVLVRRGDGCPLKPLVPVYLPAELHHLHDREDLPMNAALTMTRRDVRLSLDVQLLANVRRLGLDLSLERGVARLSLSALVEEALAEMLRTQGPKGPSQGEMT